jgi:hemerythrin-like metal-binding protein
MSIDGDVIDDDHKHWLSLANSIGESLDGGIDRERILDCLKKLQFYTVYHFAREESIQKKIGLPDQEQHIESHRRLSSVVENAIKLFEHEISDEKSARLAVDMARLLNAWIVGHIVKQDFAVRPYIKAYRQGPHLGPISTI